jgi:hypothetical protein
MDKDIFYHKYGIIQIDSINYQRRFGNFDGEIRKINWKKVLYKNSLVKILDINETKNEIIFETNESFISEVPFSKSIFKDTVVTKKDYILIFDSLKFPDKYVCEIFSQLYKSSANSPKINSVKFNKNNDAFIIDCEYGDGISGYLIKGMYKIIKNKLYYVGQECNDCKFDFLDNYIVVYNNFKVELFKTTLDIRYADPDELHPKLKLEYNGTPNELIIDNFNKELTIKSKIHPHDNYYNFEIYEIADDEFKRLKFKQ